MENTADKIMEDTIADYERRIVAIQKAKQTQGRSAAVAQYVPSCKGNDNLYCLGAYTNSLGAAMNKNGVSPRESGLMQATAAEKGNYQAEKWGSPQISCPGATNYFETNKNADVKACGKSLKDMPKGTTLGEMLAQGYKDGSIPKGSLVMVRSDGNTSGTGMHAAMFVGLSEKGEPLFSSANPEMIRQPMSKWSNQVAADGKSRDTDCYVVNTKKALEAKVPETRQPQKAQTQEQTQVHASVGHVGRKSGMVGKAGGSVGFPSFSFGRKGNGNQSKKRGSFSSGRVAAAQGNVGKGGNDSAANSGQQQKKASVGHVGRKSGMVGKVGGSVGFPSFSFGRKGNGNSADANQSKKRGGFSSGRVAAAQGNVGRGGTAHIGQRKKVAVLGKTNNSPLSVNGVIDTLKDAAKNISDKLRETVSNIGGRREVRNEIRARAKNRCALKTVKRVRQKKAVLAKGNVAARAQVKKTNLMKTLMRNTAPTQTARTSNRQSMAQKMETSPALKKAMLGRRYSR